MTTSAIIWPLFAVLAKSKYHLMLSEPISGEETERIGLVALCVEDEEVMDRAWTLPGNWQLGPSPQ